MGGLRLVVVVQIGWMLRCFVCMSHAMLRDRVFEDMAAA